MKYSAKEYGAQEYGAKEYGAKEYGAKNTLSVTSHINWSVARCLINVVYLTARAFIRSW